MSTFDQITGRTGPVVVTRPDPRMAGYLISGMGAIIIAIATGRHELAALGVPLVALAALGLADQRNPQVKGKMHLDAARVIEGDEVEGTIELDWQGQAELDVMMVGLPGVTVLDPEGAATGWALPAGEGPATLRFRLQARNWGRHRLGQVWVRARRPGGLITWEAEVINPGPTLRVLPAPLRLDRLLRPAEPRTVAGMHLSRLRGSGTDFAELRPYQPGDNLRDLSWGTSARLGEPWVIVHHPERTGTVVLMLDSYFADDTASTEGLARAARTAWAVAAVHLRAQDRVGLMAVGRTTAWLPVQSGRRARWLLLDELLSVGGAAEDWRERRRGLRAGIPSDALVVGVTTLRSPGFVRDLLHYKRHGHTTVALVINTADLLPQPTDRADAAALRLWLATRDAEKHRLESNGVPTAMVSAAEGAKGAINLLRRATERPSTGAPAGAAVR